MEFRYNKLRGKIIEKFGTLSKFASELSKFKNKTIAVQVVSAKLLGNIRFMIGDVADWSTVLGIPAEEVGTYFFDFELSKDETERIKKITVNQ